MGATNKTIFTICSVNYLDKAITLCNSVKENNPEIITNIFIVDTKRSISININGINIIWIEDINFPNLKECAFKYNIIEFNTAVKPYCALYLLNFYEYIIYLDPDIYVVNPLDNIFEDLQKYSIVLSPHSLSPYNGIGRPCDIDLLRFGSYNLGFFAVRKNSDALKFLSWWNDVCSMNCFYEPQIGLGVDQKWIDLAPSFFNGVLTCKNFGINVAFWNLHERQLAKVNGKWFVNEVYPLIFIHFSSFDALNINVIADKQTRYPDGSRQDFISIASEYSEKLLSSKYLTGASSSEYGYSHFSNGISISPALRRFYALKINDFKDVVNPFQSNSEVYKFAKKNSLLITGIPIVSHSNFKVQDNYKFAQRFLRFMFRMALMILGPIRYFNLMRYLSHYSSILNQKDLLD